MTRTAGSDSWLRAVGVAQIAPVRVAAAAANPLHLRFPTRVTQITPLAWRERCYLSRVARRAVRGGGGGASGRRVASATTCVRPSALLLLNYYYYYYQGLSAILLLSLSMEDGARAFGASAPRAAEGPRKRLR